MKIRASLFATVALLSSACPAMAESTVHFSVGPVTYTLVDLAPDDGIAPSLTFGNFETPRIRAEYSKIGAGAWDGVLAGSSTVYGDPLLPGEDATSFKSSGNSTSHAAISDWRDPATLRISLDGHIDRRGEKASAEAKLYTGAMVFELSPNTAVRFAVKTRVDALLNEDPQALSGLYTYANLAVHRAGEDWWPAEDAFHGYYGTSENPVVHQSVTLVQSLHNASADFLFGAVELNTEISLFSQGRVPSVPEPATWATLAGGLGLLGLYRRRVHRSSTR
ncbi:PEP-CTERM sorting domain-containing protein [[Empedobacter] haloabium]|uniref:PEP-CTERM sorting domain-containing protein n=1 Tax=[Empedobacter] haloabium TaxID=592317 RepID=A0ABZ1UIK3_9BURK